MYTKHGDLVDANTSGAKASTKHLESHLEVIQGQAFWDHWKADEGLHIHRLGTGGSLNLLYKPIC